MQNVDVDTARANDDADARVGNSSLKTLPGYVRSQSVNAQQYLALLEQEKAGTHAPMSTREVAMTKGFAAASMPVAARVNGHPMHAPSRVKFINDIGWQVANGQVVKEGVIITHPTKVGPDGKPLTKAVNLRFNPKDGKPWGQDAQYKSLVKQGWIQEIKQ